MLIIRYRRIGKRNHAQFKIVVAEKSFSVDGKFIEALGSYDPHSKEVVLKKDRINYWLGVGAQCSDSVYNLFISNGLVKGSKRKINIPKPAKSENLSADGENSEEPKEATATEDKKEESKNDNQEEKKEEIKETVKKTENQKEETKKEDKKEGEKEEEKEKLEKSPADEGRNIQQGAKPEAKKEDKK